MKIQISLNREQQIVAGIEPVASAVVEIPLTDIPEDLRGHLASMRVLEGGVIALEAIIRTVGCQTYITVSEPAAGTPETVLAWLREYAAVVNRKRAEREAEIAKREATEVGDLQSYIASPVADRISRRQQLAGYGRGFREYWQARELTVPQSCSEELRTQYEAALAEARTEGDRRTKTEVEEAEQAKAEAEEAEQAKAARKHTQLADAVSRLGDESQQARWAEGMLPTREAVGLIVTEAMAPIVATGLEIVGDVAPEIEHADGCRDYGQDEEEPGIEVDETVLTKLRSGPYSLLRKVRAAVPQGATVESVKVTATCESCKARGSLVYVRAAWTVGEIDVGVNVIS
jgi:hypothetical protein